MFQVLRKTKVSKTGWKSLVKCIKIKGLKYVKINRIHSWDSNDFSSFLFFWCQLAGTYCTRHNMLESRSWYTLRNIQPGKYNRVMRPMKLSG